MQVPVELKIKYLNRRMADVQHLKELLEHEDFSLALKVGHQVKGNAVTFDVPQMAQLGLEIEKAAQRKDKERVKLLLDKMQSVIESIQGTIQ